MKTLMKALGYVALLFGLAVVAEISIVILFPLEGDEVFLFIPAIIAITLGISLVGGIALATAVTKREQVWVASCALILDLVVISALHATDGGLKPHSYVAASIAALFKYPFLDYKTAYAEGQSNAASKMAAIAKYSGLLPKRAVVVHYYEHEDIEWKDRERLAFELRPSGWRCVNLSHRPILADLRVTDELFRGKVRTVYTFSIQGREFRQQLWVYQGTHHYNPVDRWKPGEPYIVALDWEPRSQKLYLSLYKDLLPTDVIVGMPPVGAVPSSWLARVRCYEALYSYELRHISNEVVGGAGTSVQFHHRRTESGTR